MAANQVSNIADMTLTAVLLAGGESRRMGTRQGDNCLSTTSRSGNGRSSFCVDFIRRRFSFPPGKNLPGCRATSNCFWMSRRHAGQSVAWRKLWQQMQTSHLAVLAVDMPFMTSEQMQVLWDLATTGCGVLPMIGDRAEPLAAIYPREASGDFLAALAGDDFSLQRLSGNLVERHGPTLRADDFSSVCRDKDERLYRSVQ